MRDFMPSLALGGAVVFGAMADAAEVKPHMPVSEWAKENRVVSAQSGSPYPGDWNTERSPWSDEIMDAMGLDHVCRQVSVRGSAQSTKSECALNALLAAIDQDACPILVLLPSDNEARKWNEVKFEPNVRESRGVRDKVAPVSQTSGKGSTTTRKEYPGGFMVIGSVGSSKALQMVSYRLVLAEEVAEYDLEAGDRGDPLDQARARGFEFGDDFKLIAVSTTGEAGKDEQGRPLCKITAEFEKGTQEWLYVPCPHCHDYIRLAFDHLDEIDGKAGIVCPGCGALSEDHQRYDMIRAGRWVARCDSPATTGDATPVPGEVVPAAEIEAAATRWKIKPGHRSFQIWRGMTFTTSWSQIWADKVAVENGEKDPKVFCQQMLAEPFEAETDRPDDQALFEARGQIVKRSGEVPVWAGFLTRAVDVQHDRLEWAVYAWGENRIGARIAKGEVFGEPDDPRTWGKFREIVEVQAWDGPASKPLRPVYSYVDSGAFTQAVYNFVRPLHGWGFRAIKGFDGKKGHEKPLVADGTKQKVRIEQRVVGRIIPKIIGAHVGKTRAYMALQAGLASGTGPMQPGSVFFPADATEEDFRQLTAERLKRDDPRYVAGQWVKYAGRANEQLDLLVYNLAAAEAAGLSRLTPENWVTLREENRPEGSVEAEARPLESLMIGVPEGAGVLKPGEGEAVGAGVKAEKLQTPSWRDAIRKRGSKA